MKKCMGIAAALAALAAGVAIGLSIPRSADGAAQETKREAPKRHRHMVAEEKADNASAALRARVRDLEAQVAELTRRLAATNESARAERADAGRREGPPHDFAKRMEEMKKNEPEKYAQMTNRMATWRARQLRQTENRLEMLASADVSRMTAKERETHERLQELIARREEMFEQMRPDSGLSEEERRTRRDEMHKTFGEIRQLEEAERTTLLTHAANDLGFTGADAKEVVESIKSIYEATQSGGPGGGRGGPPPPRR